MSNHLSGCKPRSKTHDVSKKHPCSVCGATDGCTYAEDGFLFCRKKSGEQAGFIYLGTAKGDPQYRLYRRLGDPLLEQHEQPNHRHNGTAKDWPRLACQYQAALTPARRDELADDLGIPAAFLDRLSVGWNEGQHCWTFPEVDAAGQVVGITRRFKDGTKKDMADGHRGAYVPSDWRQLEEGPILLPEGPSDVLACRAMGLCAIGRPSNRGGGGILAGLLQNTGMREILVVGDVDAKSSGDWPGRDGAVQTARELSVQLGRVVNYAFPPDNVKDVRKWFNGLALDLSCQDALEEAGERLLGHLHAHKKEVHDPESNVPVEPSAPAPGATPLLQRACAIMDRLINWLWANRLAYGMSSILDGDPDCGKSTMMADLAARVSRGWAMPPEKGGTPVHEPGNVLILNAEDPEFVIKIRLRLAGADLERVFIMGGIRRGLVEDDVVLPFDVGIVEEVIRQHAICFVLIDPLKAYLAGEIDARKDQDVRRCLRRLMKVAESTGAAFLTSRHLNKLEGGPALYRGSDSIGIIGAVRSGLIVGTHPQKPGSYVLARNKGNLAPPWRSLEYSLVGVEGEQLARIGWGAETDLMAEDILGHPRHRKTVDQQAADDIGAALADGPMPSEELEKKLLAQGHSKHAIVDGRKKAGVQAYLQGFGKEGKWMVRLPKESPGSPESPDSPCTHTKAEPL
jgi:hypothetical protein